VQIARHEGEESLEFADDLAAADVLANSVEDQAIPADEADQGDAAADDVAEPADSKQKFLQAHHDVDVLYVEASPEQINGLLRELRDRGDVLAMAGDGIESLKKNGRAEAYSADRFREFADLKELEELKEEARFAAPDGRDLTAQADADRPLASALAEGPAAFKADAEKQGFARRLSLPRAAAERADVHQLGGGARVAEVEAAPPSEAAAPHPESADVEGAEDVADAAPTPVAPQEDEAGAQPLDPAEGAAPAAPANERNVGRDKLVKAKEQGLVRVLFVLRAAAPPAKAEAEPAEVPAEAQK
jgi:hypothetical protein